MTQYEIQSVAFLKILPLRSKRPNKQSTMRLRLRLALWFGLVRPIAAALHIDENSTAAV